jgi:hypothetical protein
MTKQPLDRIELLQGTLDLIILQTLRWGAMHGYGISQMIRSRSGELFKVETGSLSIRPCTAWSARAGSRRSGPGRKTISVCANTD